MGKIAGIDYGKARIGIALSDERHFLASPFKVIKPGKTHQETAKLIFESIGPAELVILGLPLKMSGEESPMSTEVRALKKELEELIPVVLWDERLTTAGVEKELRLHGMKRKKRAEVIDTLAATAILQNYLDLRGLKSLS